MSEPIPSTSEWRVVKPLVEPAWLEAHLEEPDLRVVDATVQVKLWPFARVRSGWREFKRGHIPGAAFVDLLALSDPTRVKTCGLPGCGGCSVPSASTTRPFSTAGGQPGDSKTARFLRSPALIHLPHSRRILGQSSSWTSKRFCRLSRTRQRAS